MTVLVHSTAVLTITANVTYMIITIELQSSEEMAWLQPFLLELQRREIRVKIQQAVLPQSSYDKEALLKAVRAAGELGAFAEIQDPIAWQKNLRDEWDK